MKHRSLILAAIVLAGLCGFGCRSEHSSTDTAPSSTSEITSTSSATTTGSTGGTVSAMSPEDKEFVIKTAQAGMADVTAAQTAAEKALSADVKTFANRMIQDHGKSNEELKELATVKGLALPIEVREEHKEAADHLSALTGSAFDKAYMKHMVDHHTKAVADFDKASREALDPDLKNWAAKTLPTLQDHLRQAKDIQRKQK